MASGHSVDSDVGMDSFGERKGGVEHLDCRFLHSWSSWSLAVAREGVISDSLIQSIPSQERRKPSLIALRKVETAELPHAA